jgi:hypothetical protein
MVATSLVISSFLTILFFIVGVMAGWVAREYMMNYQEGPKVHPEFFDHNGNVIPDEVIAFRFEHDYDYNEDETDED